MHPAYFIAGESVFLTDQIDRRNGRISKIVQNPIQHLMIPFKNRKAGIETRIGSGQFGEIYIILPTVMTLKIPDQCIAPLRKTFGKLTFILQTIEIGFGIETNNPAQPAKHLMGTQPTLCRQFEIGVSIPGIPWIEIEQLPHGLRKWFLSHFAGWDHRCVLATESDNVERLFLTTPSPAPKPRGCAGHQNQTRVLRVRSGSD